MAPAAGRHEWQIAPTFQSVDQLCVEFTARLSAPALEPHIFALQLLVREALNNAVLHGSAETPVGQIKCVLELSESEARVSVADNGPGFNWQAAQGRKPSTGNLETGRGLHIYQLYADKIEFNAAGNQVTLTRRLEPRPNEPD